MARQFRKRCICKLPQVNYFKPAGLPMQGLAIVVLSLEEVEAVRLKDFMGLEQKAAALRMNVSQPTFCRMLIAARQKIAEALVMGKVIKMEGGNFIMEKKIGERRKLAISLSSEDIKGNVDARFGRCRYFLIVTMGQDGVEKTELVENRQVDAPGGAGISVATTLAKYDVDSLISGNVGPRALDLLKQFEIDVYSFEGTVDDAIKNYRANKLMRIEG